MMMIIVNVANIIAQKSSSYPQTMKSNSVTRVRGEFIFVDSEMDQVKNYHLALSNKMIMGESRVYLDGIRDS